MKNRDNQTAWIPNTRNFSVRSQELPVNVLRTLQYSTLLVGALLLLATFSLDLLPDANPAFGLVQKLLLLSSTVFLLLGGLLRRLPTLFSKIAMGMLATVLIMLIAEGGCRIVDYDFNQTMSAWNATPIYYRGPTVPIGETFFRRQGKIQWEGKILTSWLKQSRVLEENFYENEEIVTVQYDEFGFRNSEPMKDWDVVFAGDSFTELGHLPDSTIYTNLVAHQLGIRVKNLGVSVTGTLSHTCYLSEFGKGPGTTDAVLVFFEGNDVKDIILELEDIQHLQKTGERRMRDLLNLRQPSFLVAMWDVAMRHQKPKRTAINARLQLGDQDLPFTVNYFPPDPKRMSDAEKKAVNQALEGWADTAHKLKLRPWLVYMPCKRRVFHEQLSFPPDAAKYEREWEPNALPDFIHAICNQQNMGFIDTTTSLTQAARNGKPTFNLLFDTHLNELGSEIVAEIICQAFQDSGLNKTVPSRSFTE